MNPTDRTERITLWIVMALVYVLLLAPMGAILLFMGLSDPAGVPEFGPVSPRLQTKAIIYGLALIVLPLVFARRIHTAMLYGPRGRR
jgi:hypothetical protein